MRNKLDIINAASSAFGNINYIGDNNIVTNECDMEAGYIKDYFVGKKPMEIGDLFSQFNIDTSSCILFLTDKAFLYYLPGFIALVLNSYDEADLFTDTLIHKLSSEKNYNVKKLVSALTIDQKKSIFYFLKYLLSNHYDDLSDSEVLEINNALNIFYG